MENIDLEKYFVIPNPLYDVVFKYLMEDNESAKILLSTILNQKIKHLVFEPLSKTEIVQSPIHEKEIQLFHMDFTATLESPDGKDEMVMIELQKANRASDIFRFKRYIATNFQRKQKKELFNPISGILEKVDMPIRLIPIFILNFRIENEVNDLVIHSKRFKTGIFKDKILEEHCDFIDYLTYDMFVIQLPNLSNIKLADYQGNEYKTRLYTLFQLFNQKSKLEKNKHRLLQLKTHFPKEFERLLNRLKAADANYPDLESQMHTEDELQAEINRMSNDISFLKGKLEVTSKELEYASKELENERLRNREKMVQLAKFLKDNGIAIEKIGEQTGLNFSEIEKL